MHWRPFRKADLAACLEIQPECIGDQILGRDAAVAVWRSLLDHPAFQANVIESELLRARPRLVACGMGVFVEPGFVNRELEHPQPGLNARIIADVARGAPVLLDRDAIAAGNARDGVDFVNMYGTWRDGVLTDNELAEVHALLGTSFVESFAGHRFNRVLKEAIGRSRIELAQATGTYRVIAEFPEHDSALVVVTPESALAAPYSIATRMYRYQAPLLRLRPAEQELLAAALDGKTDAELSADLGLSVEAIKKRWVSVFERVDAFKPEILSVADVDNTRRGPQKRHRVVAYVRAHPEELRPFAWEAAKR